ncbi:hypothetical protein V494_08204 [Pseudogymnoascus sp. VKM F-4513 (FW-928)]|nr:hypothetical protein V494_08204 [Pseudogymnoascus sp. VKM F-4513 (FW-928)]
MSGSSAGLPLRQANQTHVKSEFDVEEYMEEHLEDTPEADLDDMKSNADESDDAKKLRKKREYNRIAQREFRRRRKDKMTKLEESQSITVAEQGQEIYHLRRQNDELRAQNEIFKTQLFGNGWQNIPGMTTPPPVPSRRQPSSIGSASSILESMTNDGTMMDTLSSANMLPANQLAITSSMLPSAVQAFAGAMPSSNNIHGIQYSIAHPAGSRGSSQDFTSGIEFSAIASGSSSYQAMTTMPLAMSSISASSHVMSQMPLATQQAFSSRSVAERSNLIAIAPASRIKTSTSISALFLPLMNEAHSFPSPTSNQPCPRHHQILAAIGPSLPAPFRPTATQLSTPHYFGVDLLPSPSLRNRLCRAGAEVSFAFLHEFDCFLLTSNLDESRLTIWGEDPYNEFSWEFSAEMLSRWGWLVGPQWVERANFWRTQRNQPTLPMQVEAPEGSLWGMWQQVRLGVLGGDTVVGTAVVGMAGLGLQQQGHQHM